MNVYDVYFQVGAGNKQESYRLKAEDEYHALLGARFEMIRAYGNVIATRVRLVDSDAFGSKSEIEWTAAELDEANTKKCYNVTLAYNLAEKAAEEFNPGEQPDIKRLMRAAYMHGYAQALIDRKIGVVEGDC